MNNKKTADLVKLIKEQDEAEEAQQGLQTEFKESTERLAISRFRFCLMIFLCLIPLLTFIDYQTRGFPRYSLPIVFPIFIEVMLVAIGVLSFIPEFKKHTYAFTFVLMLIMSAYHLCVLLLEKNWGMEDYIVYALLFSIVGVVMPWGGRAVADLCVPAYLFYPVGIYLGKIPINDFFIKSNIYLILFMLIVIVGASINERFRFHEFILKKQMERTNRVLEDYQTRLKRSYERMENLAIVDPLTGVYNRTYLMRYLTTDIYKTKDVHEMFSVIMYDLDQFKEINDLAGHQTGDKVLQRVVAAVRENLDSEGRIFRYGGDEFCILLPGLNLSRAVKTAEAIRRGVENHPGLSVGSLHVTISLGVLAEYLTGSIDADYVIRWADAALLESKRQGRNRVFVFDAEERKIVPPDPWLSQP